MTQDPASRDVSISRALSKILRHSAVKDKIPIDEEGWVDIQDTLSHPRLKSLRVTHQDISRVVNNCKKQRFKVQGSRIRANQGHLIPTVLTTSLKLLTPETIPLVIYHGTYLKKLPLIFTSGGLSRMTRNQIHFTLPSLSQILGIRGNVDALIYINVEKCLIHGLEFFSSDNEVILCPGNEQGIVPTELFDKIMDREGKVLDMSLYQKAARTAALDK